jgi:hypothetical protein
MRLIEVGASILQSVAGLSLPRSTRAQNVRRRKSCPTRKRDAGKGLFEADFTPSADPQRHPSPEARLATAAEYAAYQLGQISKKLTSLIAQMEAQRRE